MEAGRYIEAPRSVRQAVAKELGISYSAVNLALSFKRHSEKSLEVRERVLQYPESKVMRYVPECETIFTYNGHMHQTFENDFLLIVEIKSGKYRVYKDNTEVLGEELLQGVISSLDELEEVQKIVQGLKRR